MSARPFENIATARLRLRRPIAADTDAIFQYASDPEVTRYVGWPRHTTLAETEAFIAFSDLQWREWPVGPYVILSPEDRLVGGTGLAFDDRASAQTGYVLATAAWGRGYATEALLAMVDLAAQLRVRRLYAWCHPDHAASIRVLMKGGFDFEARLARHTEFPNLTAAGPQDAVRYSKIVEFQSGTSEGKPA